MSLLLEQDHVIMHGVSWRTFQQLLADRGERGGVLLAYDRGTVELRVPSQEIDQNHHHAGSRSIRLCA